MFVRVVKGNLEPIFAGLKKTVNQLYYGEVFKRPTYESTTGAVKDFARAIVRTVRVGDDQDEPTFVMNSTEVDIYQGVEIRYFITNSAILEVVFLDGSEQSTDKPLKTVLSLLDLEGFENFTGEVDVNVLKGNNL